MKYVIFDHEADLGIEVYGESPQELYQNALFALFSVITDLEKVEERQERELRVEDGGNLLIFFLNDVLFLFDVYKFLSKSAEIEFKKNGLFARLKGETFDEKRHEIKKLVKAVTFHNFTIEKDGKHIKARFIIDI